MSDISQRIAQILLDKEAVKISLDPPFTWSSGIKSPVYCDNRILPSFPEEREIVVNGFVEMIENSVGIPEAIGGTATAGISWAAFVAQKMNVPMFYIRPKPKEHGAGKQVEGTMPQNAKIAIVEDLFSTGGSSIRSAQACQREYGAEVLGIFGIVTYEMAACQKNFEEAGFNGQTLCRFSDILELLKQRGTFSEEEIETILQFRKDPPGWEAHLAH